MSEPLLSGEFTVISYQPHSLDHLVQDHDGTQYVMDLYVSGLLKQKHGHVNPHDLVGKTIRVEDAHPYLWLAERVELLEDFDNE